MKDSLCSLCGKPIFSALLPLISGFQFHIQVTHNECYDAEVAKNKAILDKAKKTTIDESWIAICPDEFRDIDPRKLPNPSTLVKLLAWRFGERGLLISGESGGGKTRCAWQILKREHWAGRKVMGITSYHLDKYPALLMSSGVAAAEFLTEAVTADLLLLDDVFKATMTERVQEFLIVVLDQRTSYQRPTIATVNNAHPDALGEGMTDDRRGPMVRRFVNYFTSVTV